MKRSLKSLFHRTEGQVTVMLALASVPLLLAAGSAIDYMRYVDTKTSVQAALDGAALAAALPPDMTDAKRINLAKDYFRKNVSVQDDKGGDIDIDVVVAETTVTARVNSRMATSFMAIGGIHTMVIDEMAEVMRPFDGKAEVALVLDYSGSMNQKGKYQSMASAATGMIDELDAALKDDALKIGVVPFSAMVYTSMNKNYVNQASATETWTGCTQDRKYPYNTTVDTPTADSATKWGYIDGNGENGGQYGCSAYDNKNLMIKPLTSNVASIKTAIGKMRPLGNTNIPLGAEFGWNLLDRQEPYAEGAPYNDKKTRKFMVLLTDGVQTSREFGEDNGRAVSHGNDNLVTLCTNMRDAGITVFTIAYDITDPKVTDLLKACAPGRYFEPDANGNEIKQVFNQITSQIKNRVARMSR